jgi:hypothetical protein
VFAEDASWQLRGDLLISGSWNGRDAIVDEFLATALSYYEPGSVSLEVTSVGRIRAVREYMDTLYAHRVALSAAS